MKDVVSFDLDGTLHSSVRDHGPRGIHPTDPYDPEKWRPNESVIRKLRDEAKTSTIVIVSARHEDSRPVVDEFVKLRQLPVSDVYLTNDRPKRPYLIQCGAIRHYDDLDMTDQLADTDIEFVLVSNGMVAENVITDTVGSFKSNPSIIDLLGEIKSDLAKKNAPLLRGVLDSFKSKDPKLFAEFISSFKGVHTQEEMSELVDNLRGTLNRNEVQQLVQALRHPTNSNIR